MQSHNNLEMSTHQIVENLKIISQEYSDKKNFLSSLVDKCDSIDVISETDISYRTKMHYIEEIEKTLKIMNSLHEEYQKFYKEFCVRNKIEGY